MGASVMGEMRPPDILGPAACAWRSRVTPKTPDQTATLAAFVVNAPHAHPFWEWWMLAVCHLRPIDGARPPIKRYPGAEFELMIAAIHPAQSHPHPDAGGWPLLTPIDVVEQFDGLSDRDARRVAEACVRAIVDGALSPDQDYRALWHASIAETVRCIRAGNHLEH